MKIICIGNYVPRRCGIATFTENLTRAILQAAEINAMSIELEVIPMNDPGQKYSYPSIVKRSIDAAEKDQYSSVADYINDSGAEICLLQHEYGIFGGDSGLLILSLLRRLKIPLITTCHTVLNKPGFHQKAVLRKICEYSCRIVVMSKLAKEFLLDLYQVPISKVVIIEHGVPDFAAMNQRLHAKPDHWKNRKILLTFGLIGRNKGIETVIRALPEIVIKHPDILYVVLGRTHPNVVREVGEEYRNFLENLTEQLGLGQYVVFMNDYLSEIRLMSLLKATDIYVTPYLNQAQITSGTLSYAVAAGCAVVSTPYWHARELLADGRGLLFHFGNYCELADLVNQLMEDPVQMADLKEKAAVYGKDISWPKIGKAYIEMFNGVMAQPGLIPFDISHQPLPSYPVFDITHLERLTDSTGLLQHGSSCIPFFRTGYCLDDNSRALIVCLRAWLNDPSEKYETLIIRYLSYITFMSQKDGRFNNYLTFERTALMQDYSDDAFGRTLWALGYLVRHAPNDSLFQTGIHLFKHSLKNLPVLNYARGYANCIFGLYHYLKRFPDQDEFLLLLVNLADRLCARYRQNQSESWNWFEETITYDNGILPAALYKAFNLTYNSEYLRIADEACAFLESKCLNNDRLSLIGNRKWLGHDGEFDLFAQQPIDAMAMVIMYESAWSAKKTDACIEKLRSSFNWFFGKNDLDMPVYDETTKGCNDGIEEFNINRNQGAESIIAYLWSRQIAERFISR